jgi:hypothetical protein
MASRGELFARICFEELLPESKFEHNLHVPWLARLKFDGYDPDLGLAFEYHGKQHYEYIPHFHRNGLIDYIIQRSRDKLKLELSDKNWVTVIVIPYTVSIMDMMSFIRNELDILGYRPRPLTAVRTNEQILENFEVKNEFGGIRRTAEEDLIIQVDSCGYTFLELRIRNDARGRREMHVRCPAGHEYWVLRDNFFPLKDQIPLRDKVPKKACIYCQRARTNQAKAMEERQVRAIQMGLESRSSFAPRDEAASWKCMHCDHEFEASWVALISRHHGYCFNCRAVK